MIKTIPFTYLIKHIPTNKYYYGVMYRKSCHPNDFWTKYFTSSKKVKNLIRKYGKKSFKFEIIVPSKSKNDDLTIIGINFNSHGKIESGCITFAPNDAISLQIS